MRILFQHVNSTTQKLTEEKMPGCRVHDHQSSGTRRALRTSFAYVGCTFAAAMLVGCSSSGSGGFHTDARFATADEDSFATAVETMEEGEEVRLPMSQESYFAEGADHSSELSGQSGIFTLRMEEDGHSVTIETPNDSFSWDAGSVDVGEGFLIASDISGNEAMTQTRIFSRYFEYVHFGLWEVASFSEEFEHERTDGGVFRQGFQTEPGNVPTTGSATYEGGMIGKVFSGGEAGFEIDGTFTLHADFAGQRVHGMIDTLGQFNNISLESGSIHDGNRFSGAAVTESSSATRSFSGGVRGGYEGGFYGPAAEEVGGTWRLEEGNDFAVGAFGGPQN